MGKNKEIKKLKERLEKLEKEEEEEKEKIIDDNDIKKDINTKGWID